MCEQSDPSTITTVSRAARLQCAQSTNDAARPPRLTVELGADLRELWRPRSTTWAVDRVVGATVPKEGTEDVTPAWTSPSTAQP